MRTLTPKDRTSIVAQLSATLWKNPDFVAYLRRIRDDHDGRLNCVLSLPIGPPHPVHFVEGMSVRNQLRAMPETAGWTSHDYDHWWEALTLEAIREDEDVPEGEILRYVEVMILCGRPAEGRVAARYDRVAGAVRELVAGWLARRRVRKQVKW